MAAEPVPIIPLDDGNFVSDATREVVLGECRCPGRPHDADVAEVHVELPWDILVDVGLLTGGAAYRRLVLGALISWNLTDAEGEPIPVDATTVARLRPDRLDPIADAVNDAYQRASAPLPNASGAPSRRSRRDSASANPTIRPHAKRTR
jgi:hypothetical protein